MTDIPVFASFLMPDDKTDNMVGTPTMFRPERIHIWAHGELEDELGHDCVYHVDGHIADKPSQWAQVHTAPNSYFIVDLFLLPTDLPGGIAGLLVFSGDHDSLPDKVW